MKNVTILLAVMAMLATLAPADVVLYEGFGYADPDPAPYVLNSVGGSELGFVSGSTWTTRSNRVDIKLADGSVDLDNVNFPFPPTGNRLDHDTSGAGGAYRKVTGNALMDFNGTDDFYVSVLFRRTGSASNRQMYVSFSRDTNEGNTRFAFGIDNSRYWYISGGKSAAQEPNADDTYFLVAKISIGARGTQLHTGYLKVYKANETVDQTDSTLSWTVTGDFSTGGAHLGNYINLSLSGADPHGQIDEIRMGKSWADVAVPEPATMALLGIGGIGVLIRRKRR